jgi:predicted ribosome quality control (RQC) complex YloA/Tae2 family protein
VAKEDENHHKHLELSACYAFDRKKHVEKKLNIGQGLIGQAFLDASTTLLKQIPDSYLHITSGLGHAMPRCVVIVPMKNNEKVEAIAELATFEEYLPHEVAFFEKCGEFIASAIATAQQAQRNQAMMERMQSQTEQLRNQEEELRQNIEELEATQEAMRRQAQETKTDTKVIL